MTWLISGHASRLGIDFVFALVMLEVCDGMQHISILVQLHNLTATRHGIFILLVLWMLQVCNGEQHTSVFLRLYNLTGDSLSNSTDTHLFRVLYP